MMPRALSLCGSFVFQSFSHVDSSVQLDCEASQVAALNQAPTSSARPANSETSRRLVKPQRTAESAWAVHQPKCTERKEAGMRRPFVTRRKNKDKALPKLQRKENMDLDDNRSSGKVKKGKTKEDTKDGRSHPHPGRKLHVVYLDDDAIEDSEANLAYHKKFLENVFGSRTSEIIIVISFSGDCNRFTAWLTDEEGRI